ncbi:MAG TPA: carboxylesterase/lipase family protein [Streptosporangiaceae bacterium]|nr:carboxylesterase/lipase family protein [Streptosporangiaceae bacterium]
MGPTVITRSGAVRGQVRDGVASFLGIPYAASPTGPLRFRAPAPPENWDGVREAAALGATPPKPDYASPFDELLPEPNIPGDDWLNLNVWTPDPGAASLPVMVWIHGGGFSNGNSALPIYDGHPFARDGVVLVTINYRLGVDGFALLPGAPANRGLLDQIAALEWVRDNIAAFGGDPGNVTVFGESAGAMSVTTLLAMPGAQGLFARAITQSGSVQSVADPADAALVTKELGLALGREPDAASLAVVGLPELIKAQAEVRDALASQPDPARFGATIVASALPFIPVVDGDLLPARPLDAIAAGAGSDVTLLTGTNTEEFRLFLVPTGLAGLLDEPGLAGVLTILGVGQPAADLYRANRPAAAPGDVLCAVLTDRYFRIPALSVARARRGAAAPTYLYEFAWPSPVGGLGACHSLEIPFVFDNLLAEGAEPAIGPEPPAALAERMHAAWISFARDGNPGWPAFDDSYPVMVFNTTGGGLHKDPRGDERTIWDQS